MSRGLGQPEWGHGLNLLPSSSLGLSPVSMVSPPYPPQPSCDPTSHTLQATLHMGQTGTW